ncbi:MAG: TIGR00725 family protein [Verrucomicrobiota bacterium]
MTNRRLKIGVVGPHECTKEDWALGVEVGAEIARRGAILVCGGLGGMMAAAAEGAKSQNGLTIGILPGERSSEANPFIEVAMPTGLGPFRNMLIVRACEAVIAVRGGYGTLSEIAFALRLGVPVVGLRTWSVAQDGRTDPGVHVADTPADAVALAFRLAGKATP